MWGDDKVIMEHKPSTTPNPLGLNIDFMFGRGYLWARSERLSDWMVLESLRMEIPDLQFPFDARGGLNRFRHTRCLVREIEVGISEAGLQELLHRAASALEGFDELRVRFLEDAIHVSLKVSAFGVQTPLSFKVALIPPEPARVDEVHLSLYDYRAYGPLPYPARQIAFDLLTSLLGTPTLRPPGRGRSFTVGIAGDILSFRPLKLILLHIFPRVGWKLPNLSGVMLDGAKIRPGQVSIRASGREDGWHTVQQDQFHLASSAEGARALAAYEAKDLFSHVDQAIFENQPNRALELLETFREVYGAHPELVNRTFDCLLSSPTATNLAEAGALLRELEREDAEHLGALLAAPTLAMLSRQRPAKVIEALERLSVALKRRQELDDWILCEQTIAQHLRGIDAQAAALRLREVLKLAPRNLQTLELLRELYEELGEFDGYEEILKRLTGLYTERHTLKATYMTLATHLMERRGQVAEARLYLERVLRLDPSDKAALYTLGESYVLSDEPLRAIKAFGSAARAAQAEQDWQQAAQLQLRIAQHWSKELESPSEGLLSARRALQHLEQLLVPGEDEEEPQTQIKRLPEEAQLLRLDVLELAAKLGQARERADEALDYWTQLLPELEARYAQVLEGQGALKAAKPSWESHALLGLRQIVEPEDAQDQARSPWLRRLLQAHEQIARIDQQRGRPEAAAGHWRRVLELDIYAAYAVEQLEQYYRQQGRPEELIIFYRDRLLSPIDEDQRMSVELKLATIYEQLQMVEEAQLHLQEVLRIKPTHDIARAKLVDLLRAHGRFETLRHALQTLLIRVQDRNLRYEVLMQLGKLQLEQLKQPRQAGRAFFEALDVRHSDEAALVGARKALDELILHEGVMAPAPVGADTVGRLQERLLLKLIDLLGGVEERAKLLDEVATLALHRGDAMAAQEASRRAKALRASAAPVEDAATLGERLDDLLTPIIRDDQAQGRAVLTASEVPEVKRKRFDERYLRGRLEERDLDEDELTDGDEATPQLILNDGDLEASIEQVFSPSVGKDELAGFRSKLQDVLTGQRPAGKEGIKKSDAISALLRRSTSSEAPSTPPKLKLKKPVLEADDLDDELDDELLNAIGRAGGLDEPTVVGSSEESRAVASRKPSDSALLSEALDDAWDAMALMARVDAARHAQDPAELAAALEDVLSVTPLPEHHPHLERAQYLALCRELGELLYYDLEENDQAKVYLERVREADPQGLGKEHSLLNALESIYEESGDLDRRLKLLRERMAQSQSTDMVTTYRLLIAQLLWDERRDYEGATQELSVILEADARHEAAHRFWAQLAREREDWPTAAGHYEEVLQERVGGLDEVELERELADIYLHKLRQPLRARQHYEGVLQASPADAQALEGIKESQAMLGDWAGYLLSLGRELALLLGQTQPLVFAELETALLLERVAPVLRTSASQIISDGAQVAQDELKDDQLAHKLWGLGFALWPEHFEALERRLQLSRKLGEPQALATDLEAWAEVIFDAQERFELLYEAARLQLEQLGDEERARITLAEAIAVASDAEGEPARLDEARRLLRSLSD